MMDGKGFFATLVMSFMEKSHLLDQSYAMKDGKDLCAMIDFASMIALEMENAEKESALVKLDSQEMIVLTRNVRMFARIKGHAFMEFANAMKGSWEKIAQ